MRVLYLTAFIAGQLIIPYLPQLPQWPQFMAVAGFVVLLWRFQRTQWLLIALLSGAALASYSCHQLLEQLLSPVYENTLLQITGRVEGLPTENTQRVQFRMRIEIVKSLGEDTSAASTSLPAFGSRLIQLSYYPPATPNSQQAPDQVNRLQLKPGQRLSATVKLKRPRGLINPGGFNYEAWLLSEDIQAVGYAKTIRLELAGEEGGACSGFAWIDCQRLQLGYWLDSHEASGLIRQSGLLRALLIGDKSGINADQWDVLVATGTVHLMVISGLHIGFMAGIGWLLGLFVGQALLLGISQLKPYWLALNPLTTWPVKDYLLKLPLPYLLGCVFAFGTALLYSQLAGYGVATQRALVMLSLFYLAMLWRRPVAAFRLLLLAAAMVLWLDPLAGFRAGFWLSFGIVGLLIFGLAARNASPVSVPDEPDRWQVYARKPMAYLGALGRVQWLIFLGMLCPLFFLLGQSSLLSPFANLVAVPVVSVAVVPPLIVAALVPDSAVNISYILLKVSSVSLYFIYDYLNFLVAISGFFTNTLEPYAWIAKFKEAFLGLRSLGLLLCALGAIWLLLPRGWPARRIGILLMFAGLLLGLQGSGSWRDGNGLSLHVLDVGQGLSVVVLDGEHALVFDAGARFSDRFDTGADIIAPFLQHNGVHRLDKVIISHGDWDHRSGLPGLLDNIAAAEIISGEPEKVGWAKPCHAALKWSWGKHHYRFLQAEPPLGELAKGNNRSCNLLIEGPDQRVLITGDIERSAEEWLLAQKQLPENIDLLIAPHHGSRTSSSLGFVQQLAPKHVVFSSGYLNRYGHPHAEVLARYAAVGSRIWLTSTQGAVSFDWHGDELGAAAERETSRRFWYFPASNNH